MKTIKSRLGCAVLMGVMLAGCVGKDDEPREETMSPVAEPEAGPPPPVPSDGAPPSSVDPDGGPFVPPAEAGADAMPRDAMPNDAMPNDAMPDDAMPPRSDAQMVENCATPGGLPCDDQDACNGREACDPNHADADGRGCVKLTAAVSCPATQACQPSSGTCSSCALNPDADGDGERAIACGGRDCDDSDPKVGPSQPELCNGRDDDCSGVVDDGTASSSCKAPLGGVASCSAGACAATCLDPKQAIVSDACVAPPCSGSGCGGGVVKSTKLDVAVYLARNLRSCFLGAPCDPEVDDCTTGLYDDDGALVHAFRRDTLMALPDGDPGLHSTWPSVCLDLVMSDAQRDDALAQLEQFRSNVLAWTSGAVDLTIHAYDLELMNIGQERFGDGTWIAPPNIKANLYGLIDFVPDFHLIMAPTRDPVKKLHHAIGACGLTLGADAGIAGAGWSWVPITKGAFWFECENHGTITHEWLHQVYTAYHQLSGFDDVYDGKFAVCGGGGDPRGWFPDTHQCNVDPDYASCGQESCTGEVNEHVLRAHWDPNLRFVANHCEDGIQDMGETGVDTGGRCDDLPTVSP
ncbi:MAG: putative metal-binding motif-containing protein [Polyangiales bacterium]